MARDSWKLTVSQGLERLRKEELSAEAWCGDLLARIAEMDPLVKAWAWVDSDGARAAAQRRDEAQGRAGNHGLSGMPFGAKDIIDVAGLPCEGGSVLYAGRMAARDANAVAALRAAGAIVLGKTVTCELATNAISPTGNPWNLDHTPGGSSAGSAAAVAVGMVPAALGTQTGGSILRPAAYCGTVGFKPTFGRTSCRGVMALSWSLDHLGVITRSALDLPLLFGAMVDPAGEAEQERPGGNPAMRAPRRVGVLHRDFMPRATPEVAERVTEAVARMREAGVEIVEAHLPAELDELHAAARTIIRAESAAHYEDAFHKDSDVFGPDIRNNIVTGMMIPAVSYLRAQRFRAQFTRGLDRLFDAVDMLVTPATMDTAPKRAVSTGDPLFSEPFSASGHPAITLPIGLGDGNLPIGIQLAGRRYGDDDLMAHAAWCETRLGWTVGVAAPYRSSQVSEGNRP